MSFLINATIGLVIAYLIGEQRARAGKAIGFRSMALVVLGAYTFTWVSCSEEGIVDWHPIAQIISGIGFVGAGLIWKDKGIHNLTTAILVWTMASVGVLLGLGYIVQAIVVSLMVFGILCYKKDKKDNV